MAMVDQVLNNGTMDRLERIHRLEEILSAATISSSPSSSDNPSQDAVGSCCHCQCHAQDVLSPHTSPSQTLGANSSKTNNPRTDVQCQTLSTGDIVITKVFFPDSIDNAKESK